MATFTADKVASTVPAKSLPSGVQAVSGTITIGTALADDDILEMVKVPAGAKIVDILVNLNGALDSGTNLLFDVGFGGTATATRDTFISAATIGRSAPAGGLLRMSEIDGLNTEFTAEDIIEISVSSAPQTGSTTAVFTLTALYSEDT